MIKDLIKTRNILKNIRKNNQDFIINLDNHSIDEFEWFIKKELERRDLFFEYNCNVFFECIIYYCVRYGYNEQLFLLLNEVRDIQNISIDYLKEISIKFSLKFDNLEVLDVYKEEVKFDFILSNIKLFNNKSCVILKKLINNEVKSMETICKLAELRNSYLDFFIYELINEFGFNKYYLNNKFLNSLCEFNKFEVIKNLHKNKLLNPEYNYGNFSYDVIKNGHYKLFKYLYENNFFNLESQDRSLTWRIVLFDNLKMYKLIDKDFLEHYKYTELEHCLNHASINCLNYLFELFPDLESDFLLKANEEFYKQSFLNECLKNITNIHEGDMHLDSIEYINRKSYLMKKFLNYIPSNFNAMWTLDFNFYSVKKLDIDESFLKKPREIIDNKIEDSHFCHTVQYSLFTIFIDFLVSNNHEEKEKIIDWIFESNLLKNNLILLEYLNSKNIKPYYSSKYCKRIILEEKFLEAAENSNYFSLNNLKFLKSIFDFDLSLNSNKLLRNCLINIEIHGYKNIIEIVDYLLKEKNVIKKLDKSILLQIDNEEMREKILNVIKFKEF